MLFHNFTSIILEKENNCLLVQEVLTCKLPAAENLAIVTDDLLGADKEHRNIRRDTANINIMHHRGNKMGVKHCYW